MGGSEGHVIVCSDEFFDLSPFWKRQVSAEVKSILQHWSICFHFNA